MGKCKWPVNESGRLCNKPTSNGQVYCRKHLHGSDDALSQEDINVYNEYWSQEGGQSSDYRDYDLFIEGDEVMIHNLC